MPGNRNQNDFYQTCETDFAVKARILPDWPCRRSTQLEPIRLLSTNWKRDPATEPVKEGSLVLLDWSRAGSPAQLYQTFDGDVLKVSASDDMQGFQLRSVSTGAKPNAETTCLQI